MIEQIHFPKVPSSVRSAGALAALTAAALLAATGCSEAEGQSDAGERGSSDATLAETSLQGRPSQPDGHEGHDHAGHSHAQRNDPFDHVEIELPLDFGDVEANETIKKSLLLVNNGSETMTFERVTTSCSCVTGEIETREIEPGDAAEMVATLRVPGTNGDLHKTLYVFAAGERQPIQIPVQAMISGGVEPQARPDGRDRAAAQRTPPQMKVEMKPEVADLGYLTPEESKRMTIEIMNTGDSPIRFTRVSTNCSCATGKISDEPVAPGESAELTVQMKAGPNPGPLNREVYVWAAGQPRPLEVSVKADVSYAIAAEPFFLNLLQKDKSGTIELKSLDGSPFRVLSFAGEEAVGADGDDPSQSSPTHAIRWDMSDAEPEDLPKFAILETDHPDMPLLDFRVIHPIHFAGLANQENPSWTISHDRLLLGALARGESVERTITLTGLMKDELESVTSKHGLFDVEVVEKSMKSRGLAVRVRMTPSAEAMKSGSRVLEDEIMFDAGGHESWAMIFAKLATSG